jgi:hypothetical protein
MARKAKSKPGSGKTKPVVTARDVIGIISTIHITREMKQAIKTGVADPTVKLRFCYVGSYRPAKLKRKLEKFNNRPAIKLVVTVGGNKTYETAKAFSQKQFVSLVGVTPPTPPALCKGGVTLNSPGQNQARVNHLVGTKGKTKNKIALLCNPNSAMNATEQSEWVNGIGMPGNGSTIFHAGKDNTADENDSDTFDKAFKQIKDAGMQAVVVSADPFFHEAMDELVDDANDTGLYVTYPLQDYNRAWESPAPGLATLQGPDLLMAYGQLGTVAAAVLRTGSNQGFVSANSATVDV